MSSLDKVIVGNIAIQARSLRRFLKKSHYWLSYDADRETAALWANHNAGGEMLLEIRNCSYESAVRLAAELGLAQVSDSEQPTHWEKWNPVVTLHDDGSAASDTLRREAASLGLPLVKVSSKECGLANGTGLYSLGMFSLYKMLELLNEWASKYREQLDSEP